MLPEFLTSRMSQTCEKRTSIHDASHLQHETKNKDLGSVAEEFLPVLKLFACVGQFTPSSLSNADRHILVQDRKPCKAGRIGGSPRLPSLLDFVSPEARYCARRETETEGCRVCSER
jgi:hypothetical protein